MKKHTFKKLLSLVLSAVMVLGTLVVLPLTVGAEAPTAWDGTTYDYSWYSANGGTEASPYLIGSPAALAGLSALSNGTQASNAGVSGIVSFVDKYIKLTADINLGSHALSPIKGAQVVNEKLGTGDNATDYVRTINGAIHFDGANFTIYNMKMESINEGGLFAVAGNGSELKNVKFVGADVDSSKTSAVLVGRVGSNITVTNVHVDGTSSVEVSDLGKREPAAGIIGYVDDMENKTGKTVITNCSNGASILGVRCAAGIVGRLGGYVDVTIDYCANYGKITAKMGLVEENGETIAKTEINVGGIVANFRHQSSPALAEFPFVPSDANSDEYKAYVGFTTTITNCYNTGSLFGTGRSDQYMSHGGIIGRKWAQDGSKIVVRDCYDYSYRNLTGAKMLTAGILGNGRADAITWLEYSYCFPAANPENENDYGTAYSQVYEPLAKDIDSSTRYFVTSVDLVSGLGASITRSDGSKTSLLGAINAINSKLGLALLEVEGVEIVDPDPDYTWYAADAGTKEKPYAIGTAAQWAGLVKLSRGEQGEDCEIQNFDLNGKYVVLTADLDFVEFAGIKPLGGSTFPTLYLDGQGHTVKNLKMADVGDVALIGSVGNGSIIASINVASSSFTSRAVRAAAVVAVSKANVSILNCHVDAATTVTSTQSYAAGILAFINDADTKKTGAEDDPITLVAYCTNAATVTGKDTVGGIIARWAANIDGTVTYCVNKGDIEAVEATITQHAGGIISYIAGSADPKAVTVTHCYNTGMQKVRVAGMNNYIMAAGIVARHLDNTASEMYMINCHDYGAKDVAIKDGNKPAGASGIWNQGYQEVYREFYNCYAANPEDTVTIMSAVNSASSFTMTYEVSCRLLESIDEDIVNYLGENSTMLAEMAKIDAAIAEFDMNDLDVDAPTLTPEPNEPNEPKPEETTAAEDEDTEDVADDTTEPAADEGCASSVAGIGALLALTASFGFALVGKKKED